MGLASASAFAADHPVSVGGGGLTFSPAVLNISAGDTVTFTNAGGFHNAVSDPGAVTSFRCANGCDGAGGNGDPSSTAWSATVTFPTPGSVGYFCEIHGAPGQGMSGTINVTIPVELQTFEVD
ncbi:MAG: cupredoxin domain-containing protein [Rhodanobacteraceae bacterium]